MASAKTFAYGLAGAAVAAMLAGLGLGLFPPAPDCEGQGVYCREAGYGGLRSIVTLLGVLAVVLLVAATGVYLIHLRQAREANRPPPTFRVSDEPRPGIAFQRVPQGASGKPPERPPRPPT